jgi:hypothetical protein
MPTLVRSVLGLYPLRWPLRASVRSWGAAPRCSTSLLPTALGAPSRRSRARSRGHQARSLAPSVHPAYDDHWPSSLLRFDRLTLDTNHLGGRWPLFLESHQFTEVYGHHSRPPTPSFSRVPSEALGLPASILKPSVNTRSLVSMLLPRQLPKTPRQSHRYALALLR